MGFFNFKNTLIAKAKINYQNSTIDIGCEDINGLLTLISSVVESGNYSQKIKDDMNAIHKDFISILEADVDLIKTKENEERIDNLIQRAWVCEASYLLYCCYNLVFKLLVRSQQKFIRKYFFVAFEFVAELFYFNPPNHLEYNMNAPINELIDRTKILINEYEILYNEAINNNLLKKRFKLTKTETKINLSSLLANNIKKNKVC